jgi:hypothetical protein
LQLSLRQNLWPHRRVLRLGVIASLAILALVILRTFNPATTWFYPVCPFRAFTGYLCPGCGTTRALHQLLNGHLAAAFRLNPLMMLLLPFVGYSGASSALEATCGRPLPRVFIPAVYIWILLAVILVFWVLRNIPYFTMLR